MSNVRYVPNRSGLDALKRTTDMLKFLEDRAQEAANAAKSYSPIRTANYLESIGATSKVDGGEARGYVYAKDFKALWIEFGTEDTPTFAPLRKGAEAAGLKVTDK